MTVVISQHGVSLLSGGSGRLDTRLDTPPSIDCRHPDSGLAPAAAHMFSRANPTRHPGLRPGHPAQAESSRGLRHSGCAYGAKGQYDRAIQDFDQAIKLKPNYAGRLTTNREIIALRARQPSFLQKFMLGVFAPVHSGPSIDR